MTRHIPTIKCSRCKRRLRNLDTAAADGWNAVLELGIVTAILCPGCQTPLENLEAEVNDATTEITGTVGGRLVGRPKLGGGK